MQEGMSWDLHHLWNGPPWYYRLYAFYLMGAVVAGLAIVAEFWWKMGLLPGRTRRLLEGIFLHISKGDHSAVSPHVERISPRCPEAGLREWASLSSDSDRAAFIRILRKADARFRFNSERFRSSARSLITMMGLTVLLYFAPLAIDMHYMIDRMLEAKLPAAQIFVAWAHEMFEIWGAGSWVLLFLFLLYRHLLKHLERRRVHWDYFYARVNELDN